MGFPKASAIGKKKKVVPNPSSVPTTKKAPPTQAKAKTKSKPAAKSDLLFSVDEVDLDGVITPAKSKSPSLKRSPTAKQLAIVNAPRPKRSEVRELVTDSVKPAAAEALLTRFGPKAEIIVRQLDEGEADGSVSLINRGLLQMLVDLLPIAEQAVRKSNARYGVYQLIQLSSQIRESLQDLQSVRDKGLLGQNVVERIVRPSYQDLAAQIVVAFIGIEASAKTRMSKEDYRAFQADLLTTRTGLASYLTRMYDEIQKSIIESLT